MNDKNVKKFAQFEKENALFSRKYDGYAYWQFIRFYVAEACLDNRMDLLDDKLEGSVLSLIKKGLLSFLIMVKDISYYANLKKCDLLIFKNEKIKDHFFDCWKVSEIIKSYTFRIEAYSSEYSRSEHFLESPRFFDNLNKIKNQILKRKIIDKDEIHFIKRLEGELLLEFGQAPSSEYMLRKIQDGISKEKYYTRFYEKILDKTKPRAILCIVYYHPKLFSLFKLAKKRGIKIIELQHGVISNHEEYYFDDLSGYNNTMPDYLLTFGEIHRKWTKLPSQEKTVAVGFPYQESMISAVRDIIPDIKTIIIYPEADSRFESVVNEFVNKISIHGYRVMIKLHPLQVKYYEKYYPIFSNNKSIEVITSQSEGIYYWLKIAKHHVMASTTVGLEAMAFDHCNVCIAENVPHEQTQCLLDWGVARGFSTSDELFSLVIDPLKNVQNKRKIRNQLWKLNARKTIEEFFVYMAINGWEYP